MRVALRHFLLDREGTLYRLPSATLDRMLQTPTRHRLPRLAGLRVRSAEVAVEMMNGRPLRVCAVQSRRFLVGANPTRQMLQPEATGATVEVTKRLKPSGDACHDIR